MKTPIALAAALAAASAASAQTYTEVGDAGENGVADAQLITGTGTLSQINGTLTSGAEVDLYGIEIVDTSSFLATTVGGATFDSQLFLFGENGEALVENDDFGGTLQSGVNTDYFNASGAGPGLYYLAVSRFNTDPLDVNGNDPFGFSTYPGSGNQRMPAAGADLLAGFDGSSSSAAGPYSIFLTGANFVMGDDGGPDTPVIPTPSAALGALGVVGLGFLRRRRA